MNRYGTMVPKHEKYYYLGYIIVFIKKAFMNNVLHQSGCGQVFQFIKGSPWMRAILLKNYTFKTFRYICFAKCFKIVIFLTQITLRNRGGQRMVRVTYYHFSKTFVDATNLLYLLRHGFPKLILEFSTKGVIPPPSR